MCFDHYSTVRENRSYFLIVRSSTVFFTSGFDLSPVFPSSSLPLNPDRILALTS